MNIEQFVMGYLTAMLWAETDEDGDPLDCKYSVDDIASETRTDHTVICQKFAEANLKHLEAHIAIIEPWQDWTPSAIAGYDLWLTRNHHGAGFWDRGTGEHGDALTVAANLLGESHPYVDGGKVLTD